MLFKMLFSIALLMSFFALGLVKGLDIIEQWAYVVSFFGLGVISGFFFSSAFSPELLEQIEKQKIDIKNLYDLSLMKRLKEEKMDYKEQFDRLYIETLKVLGENYKMKGVPENVAVQLLKGKGHFVDHSTEEMLAFRDGFK